SESKRKQEAEEAMLVASRRRLTHCRAARSPAMKPDGLFDEGRTAPEREQAEAGSRGSDAGCIATEADTLPRRSQPGDEARKDSSGWVEDRGKDPATGTVSGGGTSLAALPRWRFLL